MGADCADTGSRCSFDDGDDPEAALNPSHGENDTVAPVFRLRRLAQDRGDVGSPFLPGAGGPMSVYVTMHRYGPFEAFGHWSTAAAAGAVPAATAAAGEHGADAIPSQHPAAGHGIHR